MIWLNMSLGAESLKVLREIIEDELGPYLTDSRFHPHLTIFRKCELSDELKEGIRASVREVRLGSVNLEKVTLRERKEPGTTVKEPILAVSLSTDQ